MKADERDIGRNRAWQVSTRIVYLSVGLALGIHLGGGPALAWDVPDVGPGRCVANCSPPSVSTGRGAGTSYVPSTPSGPSPEELERRRGEAIHDANDLGFDAYERGDWTSAIRYFEEALEYDPYNPSLKHNLRRARENLAKESRAEEERRLQARAAEQRRRKEAERKLAEVERKRKERERKLAELERKLKERERALADAEAKLGVREPRFSKGTKTSAPVDLRSTGSNKPLVVDPGKVQKPPQTARAKGLKIKEVPLPGTRRWPGPKNPGEPLKNPLWEEKKQSPFAPTPEDSKALLPAISKAPGTRQWPGPKNPGEPLKNPLWEEKKQSPFAPTPEDSKALLPAVSKTPDQR